MKRIIAISLLIVSISLAGCSSETTNPSNKEDGSSSETTNQLNKVAPWCAEDFLFYSKDGKIIKEDQATGNRPYSVVANDPKDGVTYRGVSVGDDAIEALKKYDISYCYDNAVYGVDGACKPLTADVDIESYITTSEDLIWFKFKFDKEFNSTSVSTNDKSFFELRFAIKDGKISKIYVYINP